MSASDFYVRLTRKIELGRGGMVLSQDDLDCLLFSGAYEELCLWSIKELKAARAAKNPKYQTEVPTPDVPGDNDVDQI